MQGDTSLQSSVCGAAALVAARFIAAWSGAVIVWLVHLYMPACPGVAANLRIESSIQSPIPLAPGVIPALAIVGVGGDLAMVVNAPQAIVAFTGVTTNFYGQIIGGMIPDLLITRLHYDDALNSPRLYRRGWRELRDYPPA